MILRKNIQQSWRDALGVAIDADVLAHDVLNGFDGVANGHGLSFPLVEGGLEFMDGEHEIRAGPEFLDELNGVPIVSNGGICRTWVAEIDDALILIFLQAALQARRGPAGRIW